MANHVHLLVETGHQPLSRMMQTLQFTYSQYHNRRYGKTGHLFQGRYQAILCDREPYLLELVRYLHLNPARIRTALNPWTYRWSSYATVDQRFLGDECFVEDADRRTASTREVSVRPRQVAFGTLLAAVANAHTTHPRMLLAPGRQRALVQTRAMLVSLAREWSFLTTRELGRRLYRDPSMISRLAATYAANRDTQIEAQLRKALGTREA